MAFARPAFAAAGVAAPIFTIAALVAGPVWIPLAILAWGALSAFIVTTRERGTFAAAWVTALIAFVVGLVAHYAVAIDHSLCGSGTGSVLAAASAAALFYLAASLWALRTARRAVWAWPAIVVLGWGIHLGVLFALPGAHGFCET
jgi:hypothetical protein